MREVFTLALRAPPERRRALVHETCAADAALEQEVLALLAAHASAGDLLARPVLADRDHCVLPPGTRLGWFEILGPLGSGGGGTVYRARQLDLARDVALKVQPLQALYDARGSARTEAEVTAACHHPHLAEVFSRGESEELGLAFYAMRLIEGVSLRAVLEQLARSDTAPAESTRRAMVRICHEVSGALATLHRQGLVHRDVAPSNIMLGGHGDQPWLHPAVLIDYGLVRTLQAAATTMAMGTPGYVAPEVGATEGVDYRRADVYSLGIVLQDALFGQLPAVANDQEGGGLRRRGFAVEHVDTKLAQILARCTAADPRARFADATEIEVALADWLQSPATATQHPAAVRRLARPRAWTFGGVMALGVLLGGAHWRTVQAAQVGDLAALFFWSRLAPWSGVPTAGERSALADVRQAFAMGGNAALTCAARYVARDGRVASPLLTRFLVNAIGDEANARLLARLLYERPDASPGDVDASAGLRAALWRRLIADGGDGEVPWLLVGLAGCADPDDVPNLLAFVEGRARGSAPDEPVRLALRALRSAIVRHRRCGTTAAFLRSDLLALVARVCAVVEAAPGDKVARVHLNAERDGILAAVACLLRHVGRAPPDPRWLRSMAEVSPLVLALCLDAGQRARLAVCDGPLRDETAVSHYYALFGHGQLAAAYADSAVLELAEQAAITHAERNGLSTDFARKRFAAGATAIRRELAGEGELDPIDADSRLEIGLTPRRDPQLLTMPDRPDTSPTDSRRAIVQWTFVTAQPTRSGSGQEPRLRVARHAVDEGDPAFGYLCLPAPGISEVELTFTVPDSDSPYYVALDVHKAVRGGLPLGGDAYLEVSLDGNLLTGAIRFGGPSWPPLAPPLPRLEPGRPHCLTLRLGAQSTTTLRVYTCAIRR